MEYPPNWPNYLKRSKEDLQERDDLCLKVEDLVHQYHWSQAYAGKVAGCTQSAIGKILKESAYGVATERLRRIYEALAAHGKEIDDLQASSQG